MTATFVVSLDFELLWGVRDHATRESYGDAILGGRAAAPKILALFEQHGIRATWAAVGLLLARDRDAMIAHCPVPEARPVYGDPRLSPYADLLSVGRNETEDPLHFGPSLARRILDTPGQELATHTFSHFYACEPGGTVEAFEADLASARAIAATSGLPAPSSIVFPRNQTTDAHVAACVRSGITVIRGNPPGFAYRSRAKSDISRLVRAWRLADALVPLSRIRVPPRQWGGAWDVPASRFLRPAAGITGPLAPLHLARIMSEMTVAAKTGCLYHLWWHPHNFGRNPEANLAGLKRLLVHFNALAERFGIVSRTMAECARDAAQKR